MEFWLHGRGVAVSRFLPHSVAVLRLTGVFWSRARVSRFSTRLSCFFLALLSFRGFRIWERGKKRGDFVESQDHGSWFGSEGTLRMIKFHCWPWAGTRSTSPVLEHFQE